MSSPIDPVENDRQAFAPVGCVTCRSMMGVAECQTPDLHCIRSGQLPWKSSRHRAHSRPRIALLGGIRWSPSTFRAQINDLSRQCGVRRGERVSVEPDVVFKSGATTTAQLQRSPGGLNRTVSDTRRGPPRCWRESFQSLDEKNQERIGRAAPRSLRRTRTARVVVRGSSPGSAAPPH